jgi:cytosine/adenosine deaminase-related metal-dependent hydrolase
LGCIGANTLLVHGVAMGISERQRLLDAGAGLIWCPSSNLYLFGRTAEISGLLTQGRVALGSDSRLSGGRDLLDELRTASMQCGVDDRLLEQLVTERNAHLLRLPDRGVIKAGAYADLMVLPRDAPLSMASRAEVRMVMVEGRMRYGDGEYGRLLMQPASLANINVDGRPKVLDRKLATQLARAQVTEPGLELADMVPADRQHRSALP